MVYGRMLAADEKTRKGDPGSAQPEAGNRRHLVHLEKDKRLILAPVAFSM